MNVQEMKNKIIGQILGHRIALSMRLEQERDELGRFGSGGGGGGEGKGGKGGGHKEKAAEDLSQYVANEPAGQESVRPDNVEKFNSGVKKFAKGEKLSKGEKRAMRDAVVSKVEDEVTAGDGSISRGTRLLAKAVGVDLSSFDD